MIHIDCPFCDGEATIDEATTDLACAGCGATVPVAADPVVVLDSAA